MTDLVIYGTPVSPFVRKVEALLRNQGVDYDFENINIMDMPDWFLEISPTRRIPVLRDRTIGEKGIPGTIADSSAICAYLNLKLSAGLYGESAFDTGQTVWLEEYADTELAIPGDDFFVVDRFSIADIAVGTQMTQLDSVAGTPDATRWPGNIAPGRNNGMVSIHDFLPTLASIIGVETPSDRAIDGVDQSDFFLGRQDHSNREHLITFIENEVAAVRWRQFRIYPKDFMVSGGVPARPGLAGHRAEMTSMPSIYNIEYDPREEDNLIASKAWVFRPYMGAIGAYYKSLQRYPNPKGVSLTKFDE